MKNLMTRKLILVVLLFISVRSFGQPTTTQYLGTPTTNIYIRGWGTVDSGFLNALKDTILAPVRQGEQRFRVADSSLYIAVSTGAGAKWQKAGAGSSSSSGSTSARLTSFQRNTTLIDQKFYDAFPSVAWDTSLRTASCVWKSAGSHTATGPALISYSHDGFSTFTPPDTISLNNVNLVNDNTISIGRGNGTRWIIQWNAGLTTDSIIHFARNDVENEKFTADDSFALRNYHWAAPFGKILQVSGDTIFAPCYGLDTITGHTQTSVFYVKSYNNGVSWSYGGLISYGGTFNANSMPSEFDWVIISGTKVSDTKFLGLARDDFYKGFHNELTSSDGGTTWTSHIISESNWAFGSVNAGGVVNNSWPCLLVKRDSMLYAVMGIRNTAAAGGFALRVFTGNAVSVFSSVANWNLNYTVSYRAASFYVNGGDADFGYYHPFLTPTGEVKSMFYDATAQAAFGAPYENIKSMPVIDNNYYEAYNDANQSVNSGTETTVTFPKPFLDGQLYYSSDSSKLYAASDGYYVISCNFTIDTSSLGTYRLAKLKIVDDGQEVVGGVSTRIISKVAIQPSTNSNFCWIELHGQGYLRKGEEIRVTFQHDKGSALNILNTISDSNIDGGGARVKLKKID